ncbi:hypothetical protein E2493_06515 [Sphingomonas parva]|uniref:Secreted protein n=1 Tax=Sphingomonas parva TaxID=2555898 RepID=A0A4Y8ZV32_9SPHN|nr:hypothetical protein [Sphingomonas parva]TFI59172.1 hypothetical protein E2493_06515 [Sphingomonas parva]
MKYLVIAAGALAAFTAPAAAQPAAPGGERINQLIVYGDDPCPPSTDQEITVCARKSEGERFRIPEALRGNPNDPANDAWAVRASELQYVGRSGIGSCSTSGPGGMIGCFNDLVRQARAERATRDSVNWNRLIEEARQERLGRIDADAAAVEAEQADNRR